MFAGSVKREPQRNKWRPGKRGQIYTTNDQIPLVCTGHDMIDNQRDAVTLELLSAHSIGEGPSCKPLFILTTSFLKLFSSLVKLGAAGKDPGISWPRS